MLGGVLIKAMYVDSVLDMIAGYILWVVASWEIFTKAGEEGWKSIIPFYNLYILYKISWEPMYFFLNILIIVIGACLIRMVTNPLILAVFGIIIIALIGIIFVSYYNIARAFGHGIGYAIGLYLFNPIFMLILGWGSSQYMGNKTKSDIFT